MQSAIAEHEWYTSQGQCPSCLEPTGLYFPSGASWRNPDTNSDTREQKKERLQIPLVKFAVPDRGDRVRMASPMAKPYSLVDRKARMPSVY